MSAAPRLATAKGKRPAPVLLMGDEVRRTQRGNNNAYCQDNDISWFDWTLLERHRDVHRFVRALNRPDWSEQSHALAFTLRSLHQRFLLHGMFNAWWEPLTFELPPVSPESPQRWRRCMDTALASPDDIYTWAEAPLIAESDYLVQPRSVVLLALALQELS